MTKGSTNLSSQMLQDLRTRGKQGSESMASAMDGSPMNDVISLDQRSGISLYVNTAKSDDVYKGREGVLYLTMCA